MSKPPGPPPQAVTPQQLRNMNEALLVSSARQHELAERAQKAEEQLATELAATQRLQAVSTQMILEGNVEALYEHIMDAAIDIMRSDYASLQMLYPERGSAGELHLLAFRGFNAEAAKFWEWVRADSESTCGAALRTGSRVIAPDVEKCDFMAGSADLATYLETGIHAVQSTPLVSRSGRVLGMMSTHWRQPHRPTDRDLRLLDVLARQAADLIERKHAEQVAQRLASIVESSSDAIVSKNLDGIITSWNQGAARLFGYAAEEVVGKSITVLIPDGRQHEENEILERLRRGERIEHYDTVRRRKDGSFLDISLTISPIRDAGGKVVGASKIARDITERKRAEEMQQLLLGELNHRVKNTLATIQAIAQQTLRRSTSPEQFVAGFSGRIEALARVHTLLTSTAWQGADLRELIRDQVLLGPIDETRLTAWGPSVELDPQTALHVAMVLHELATNSLKYGALSVAHGWVTVSWTKKGQELHLRWQDRGGPPVEMTERRGFGTLMIEQSVRFHGGTAQMMHDKEGVSWSIVLPRQPVAANAREQPSSMPATASTFTSEDQPARVPAPTRPAPSMAGKRILVVEDEPLVALDLAATLEEQGGGVVGPASTAEEALRLIETTPLDAALVDANLLGRPADRVAAALTQRKVPFAFVTGYDRTSLPPAFRGAPMLAKPFTATALLETIAKLIESR